MPDDIIKAESELSSMDSSLNFEAAEVPLAVPDDDTYAPPKNPKSLGNPMAQSVSQAPPHVWQSCDHDLFLQVKTRESAVNSGVVFLLNLQSSLKQHSSEIPSASKWIDRISKSRIVLRAY